MPQAFPPDPEGRNRGKGCEATSAGSFTHPGLCPHPCETGRAVTRMPASEVSQRLQGLSKHGLWPAAPCAIKRKTQKTV